MIAAFVEWLKWRIAGDELATLERYRVNLHQVDRWFAAHAEVAEVARWVRQYSEGRDDPRDPPSGLSISGLRGRVEGLRSEWLNERSRAVRQREGGAE